MPLTLAQQVRLRISDRWRYAAEVRYGDGSGSAFKLAQGAPFSNLNSGASAFVATTGGWSATGASIDTALGVITFSAIVSANSAWQTVYQWAVFSEDEIGQFTAVAANVPGAALEAVRTLMFDGLRRARWHAADGTIYDDTQALQHLREMQDRLEKEAEDIPDGGLESWSEQQQWWDAPYSLSG